MKKNEYMDILTDYLDNKVSVDEKNDIIRDIEEMIADGISSGRSEEDVIKGLGSPKQIVMDLKKYTEHTTSDDISEKVISQKNTIKDKFKKIFRREKESTEEKSCSIWKLIIRTIVALASYGLGIIVSCIAICILIAIAVAAVTGVLFVGTSTAISITMFFSIILGAGGVLLLYEFMKAFFGYRISPKKLETTTICKEGTKDE